MGSALMRGIRMVVETKIENESVVDLKGCVAWSIENQGDVLASYGPEGEGVGPIDLPKAEAREYMGISGYLYTDRIKIYFDLSTPGKKKVVVQKFIEQNLETI